MKIGKIEIKKTYTLKERIKNYKKTVKRGFRIAHKRRYFIKAVVLVSTLGLIATSFSAVILSLFSM